MGLCDFGLVYVRVYNNISKLNHVVFVFEIGALSVQVIGSGFTKKGG